MSKVKYVVFGLILGVALSVGTALAATNISVDFTSVRCFFDGTERPLPQGQGAFIYNGRTYVPLRYMGESLGKEVEFDAARKAIYVGVKPDLSTVSPSTANTLFGSWERFGSPSGRSYTEILNFYDDFTYSYMSRFDDDDECISQTTGTFSVDGSILTLKDAMGNISKRSFILMDNNNEMVLDGDTASTWHRLQ